MFDEHVYNGFRIVDKVFLVQAEFCEDRVFPDEIVNRIFELGHKVGDNLSAGFRLHVFNDVELDAQLVGYGQSIR